MLRGVILAALCVTSFLYAETPDWVKGSNAGLAVRAEAPDFKLLDQTGKERTFASLAGPKGLVLIFFRSADW